jgi:endoglucanase
LPLRRLQAAALAAIALSLCTTLPAAAAGRRSPERLRSPAHVHVAKLGHSFLILAWGRVAHARAYDVYLGRHHARTARLRFNFTRLRRCTVYHLGVRARHRRRTSAWRRLRARTAGCSTTPTPPNPVPSPLPSGGPSPLPSGAGLHVSGNQLLGASGKVVHLHGVDRSGTEYACIQGWGIFDGTGTNDDSQVSLMKAWNINTVFIGLNEDCWLGINGVSSQYGGQNYRNAITHEVSSLESAGIYPVIGLFWSAQGSQQATAQAAMPDNDHSPAFWQSVATTFKNDPNVMLRLKEEPYPAGNSDTVGAWQCWSAGDVQYGVSASLTPVSQTSHCSEGYKTVGMQSLINIIRGTGATNVIQIPGAQYANSMTHFLDSGIRPTDSLATPQLMADVDLYPNGNSCNSTACYANEYGPVAAQMPFDAGELGESSDGSDTSTSLVDTALTWFDQHNAGYYAWAWDTWGGGNQLITSYNTGAPKANWGTDYKQHIAGLS